MNSLRIGLVPLKKDNSQTVLDVDQAKWDTEEDIDGKLYADLFDARLFVGNRPVLTEGEVEDSKGTIVANAETAAKIEGLLVDYLSLLKEHEIKPPLSKDVKDLCRRVSILITALDTINRQRKVPKNYELILTVDY